MNISDSRGERLNRDSSAGRAPFDVRPTITATIAVQRAETYFIVLPPADPPSMLVWQRGGVSRHRVERRSEPGCDIVVSTRSHGGWPNWIWMAR
jgi:hypothetical protein